MLNVLHSSVTLCMYEKKGGAKARNASRSRQNVTDEKSRRQLTRAAKRKLELLVPVALIGFAMLRPLYERVLAFTVERRAQRLLLS